MISVMEPVNPDNEYPKWGNNELSTGEIVLASFFTMLWLK